MTERPSAIARAWAILGHCAAEPDGIAFNELRRRCDDIVASTLTRILEQMLAADMIARNAAGRYLVAAQARSLARRIAGSAQAGELLRPLLAELAEACAASAVWWERDGREVVLRARHDWPEGFNHSPLGTRRPLSDSAFGSCILAALDTQPDLADQLPNQAHRSAASLARELKAIRAAGCCRREDHGPHTPISRICAAVGGLGAIGISISAPLDRLDEAALGSRVTTIARRATALLEGLA